MYCIYLAINGIVLSSSNNFRVFLIASSSQFMHLETSSAMFHTHGGPLMLTCLLQVIHPYDQIKCDNKQPTQNQIVKLCYVE